MKDFLRHLGSFIAPTMLGLVIPFTIVWAESQNFTRPALVSSWILRIMGLLIGVIGLVLLILTIRTFILLGDGTIMPWDPSRKLITVNLYAYVRNPMILSLIILQVGEAILFKSPGITLLAILNFAVNTIYFLVSEEPGLEKRFGEDYRDYKKNVPRWIPRLKPWRPS